MDTESWYSVTPETISKYIANRSFPLILVITPSSVVIDAFSGTAGNSIQFAMCARHVYAIEIDAQKIRMARNNARIYGVLDKITFIHGDVFQVLKWIRGDVIFLSPPWSGPDYIRKDVFDVRVDMGLDWNELKHLASGVAKSALYYLPRNCDYSIFGECAIQEIFLNERLKCILVVYGDMEKELRNQEKLPE